MQSKPVNGRRKSKLSHTACGDSASISRAAIVAVRENVKTKAPDVRAAEPDRPCRTDQWLKIKNPVAPAVKREAKEDWGGSGTTSVVLPSVPSFGGSRGG